MSSTRRTASETNILAMLDRHATGGPGRRLLRGLRSVPALAWYGTAGVLVIGLVGSLVWLAGDGEMPMAPSPAVAVTAPVPAPAPAVPAVSTAAARIPDTDAALADAAPVPVAGATIVDLAPAAPALAPAPAPQDRTGGMLAHAVRHAPRHGRLSALAEMARTPAGKPPAARAEARNRRAAAPGQPAAPAAVDSDVALISAIIQHASKRQEAEEEARKP